MNTEKPILPAGTLPRQEKKHELELRDRQVLTLNGVTDVGRFDEEYVALQTVAGPLGVEGKDLHVKRLSLESGEVRIEGEITALYYADRQEVRGGFFRRLFG